MNLEETIGTRDQFLTKWKYKKCKKPFNAKQPKGYPYKLPKCPRCKSSKNTVLVYPGTK